MALSITTLPLPGPTTLRVRIGYGTLTVVARDEPGEAVVRLTPRDAASDVLDRFTVHLQGATLIVAGPRHGGLSDLLPGRSRERDEVDVVAEVPTGTPLSLVSGGAEITVTGRCGDTDVTTGGRSISIGNVGGDLRLRYSRADCQVETVEGSVQLRAAGGTASFGEVGGGFEGGFGSGELLVDVAQGNLRARGGSGSARVGAAHGDVDIAIGSGPIAVGLPPGVAARVDMTSGSGEIRSDLPVEEAPAADGRSITVCARTGRGEVRLLRAAAA